MEAPVSCHRALRRSYAAAMCLIQDAEPRRRIGVVDGLVSVTQTAFALTARTQQPMKVLQ